jgi:hypothetical protein
VATVLIPITLLLLPLALGVSRGKEANDVC